MLAAPADATSAASIDADNCVLDPYVVDRGDPFHITSESATKPVPVTVRVNAAPPATALDGASAVIAGTGLAGALTVNTRAEEVPPPGAGFITVSLPVPAVASFAFGTTACRLLPEAKVVTSALPFHCTTDCEMKFVPVAVTVTSPAPAVEDVGLKAVSAGTGLEVVGGGVDWLELPPQPEKLDKADAKISSRKSFVLGTFIQGRSHPHPILQRAACQHDLRF